MRLDVVGNDQKCALCILTLYAAYLMALKQLTQALVWLAQILTYQAILPGLVKAKRLPIRPTKFWTVRKLSARPRMMNCKIRQDLIRFGEASAPTVCSQSHVLSSQSDNGL